MRGLHLSSCSTVLMMHVLPTMVCVHSGGRIRLAGVDAARSESLSGAGCCVVVLEGDGVGDAECVPGSAGGGRLAECRSTICCAICAIELTAARVIVVVL